LDVVKRAHMPWKSVTVSIVFCKWFSGCVQASQPCWQVSQQVMVLASQSVAQSACLSSMGTLE
jgi:hypothetical protein